MPRNQSFVIQKMAQNQIKNYTSSDLMLGIKNNTYLELDDESSLNLPFIGSQNYLDGLNIWIFEPSFSSFLNKEFKTNMLDSFGKFFMRPSQVLSRETLIENVKLMNRKKVLYENPLLEIEEVSIAPVREVLDIDLERARRTSVAIASVFAQLQRKPIFGEFLDELDLLIAGMNYPLKNSLIDQMSVESFESENVTYNQTLRSPESPLLNEFFLDYQSWLPELQEIYNIPVNLEVFVTLVIDMSLQQPFIATIIDQFKGQGKSSVLVNEIYEQIITSENQTFGYFLGEIE